MPELAISKLPVHEQQKPLAFEASEPAVRVLRQLLEALMFEGCVDYVAVGNKDPGLTTFYINVRDLSLRCQGRIRGFGRVRLDIETLRPVEGRDHRPVAAIEMLKWVVGRLPATPRRRENLFRELAQTIHWSTEVQRHKQAEKFGRQSPLASVPEPCSDGHLYHPCFRARMGFSQSDHRLYSPESGSSFQLHWVAIPRAQVIDRLPRRAEAFWLQELGKPAFHSLYTRLRQRGRNPAEYHWLPVHPWQWDNCIGEQLQQNPRCSEWLDLGEAGDPYLATSSIRTLMNEADPRRSHVKLPMNIVSTSAVRHLLSHGVDSAPALSQGLHQVVSADPFFALHPLIVLREYAAIRAAQRVSTHEQADSICELGAIWRESIDSRIHKSEQAVPMTTVLSLGDDHGPVIRHWVAQYGLVVWLKRLLAVLVKPVWHLLVHHGIGVEAHAQNTLIVFKNGWPERVALRDFHESVEFVEPFLRDDRLSQVLKTSSPLYHNAPLNRYYWMSEHEALRELVMDTLFVYHLSELAQLCQRQWQLAEHRFWQLVRQILLDYSSSGACSSHRLAAIPWDRASIRVESLIRRKLQPPADGELHHFVPNPLATNLGI